MLESSKFLQQSSTEQILDVCILHLAQISYVSNNRKDLKETIDVCFYKNSEKIISS